VALFAVTAVAGAALDLLTKHLVFSALGNAPERTAKALPGVFQFALTTNPGIVFGIQVPPAAVLLATLAAAAAVVYLFASSPRRAWPLHLGLGMVIGGAAGNAYDRMFSSVSFPGEAHRHLCEVRDFIEFIPRTKTFSWPVFNVADVLLVAGVGLILLFMLTRRPAAQPGESAKPRRGR
jgi:signal peptidase II